MATELSPDMLEQIDQQIPSALSSYPQATITTQVCDMQTLEGVPSASADICTMMFGIMFPPNTDSALRQVKRVLKPDGVAVVTSWTWNTMMEDLNVFVYEQGRITDLADFPRPLKEGTDREYFLRIAARKAGFERVSVTYIHHADFPIGIRPIVENYVSNPLLAKYQPLEQDALERFLLSWGDGEDAKLGGPVRKVSGTALCLRLGF